MFELLGAGPDSLPDIGSLQSHLHPDDRALFADAIEQHLQDKDSPPVSLNVRHQQADGGWVHSLFKGRVIDRDTSGKPLRMIGDYVDLTHLLQLEKELQLRNENFELVNEGINAGIWEWDVASGKTTWSPRLFQLLGYEPGEVETSYDRFMHGLVHPSHIDGLTSNLEDYLNHKSPYRFEFKCLCKDGVYRWFETHGVARFDEHGKAIRMIGSMLDIDQRKQLEQKNLRSIDILTSNNQRLLNFAYIVSHNLRSHAANLLSLLDIFEGADDEQQAEIRSYLKSNAEQLLQTIEHLADVVKIQTELDKKKQRLEFAAITRRVLDGLSEIINESAIEITTDFHAVPEIDCIPAYLESILHNLISNAIKYRHPDRPATCSLSTRRTDQGIVLVCSDNGIGIDLEHHREKLFGLYKTFHGNANARGVGLFLMKNQVDSLGGWIDVESRLGEGTTFTISFP